MFNIGTKGIFSNKVIIIATTIFSLAVFALITFATFN